MVEAKRKNMTKKLSQEQKDQALAAQAKAIVSAHHKMDGHGEFETSNIVSLLCLTHQCQSDQELKMFTLPSNLSEAERIKLLLFKQDDPVQQNYVFLNAKNIFKGNPDNIQEAVIPVILDNVQVWNETVQTQAGEMFSMLIE